MAGTVYTKDQLDSLMAVIGNRISNAGGGGGGTTVSFFQVEDDGATGQTQTGTPAVVAGIWATPSITSPDFSWDGATGTLTVNKAGTVEFDLHLMGWNTGNNRNQTHLQLYKNGATVLAEDAQYSSRNGTQDEGSAVLPGFKDVATIGDTYQIRTFSVGTAASIGHPNVAGQTYISAKLYS